MSELDDRQLDAAVESADDLTMRIDQLKVIVSELQITNDELRAKLQRQENPSEELT